MHTILFIVGLVICAGFSWILYVFKTDPELARAEAEMFRRDRSRSSDPDERNIMRVYEADARAECRLGPYGRFPLWLRLCVFGLGILLMIPKFISWLS